MKTARELLDQFKNQMPKEGYALTMPATKYVGALVAIMDAQQQKIEQLEKELKDRGVIGHS